MDAVSAIAPSSPSAPQPSPWHTPVPYLFGGLAAMMGLIAFALMILACSYWKLSGYFDNTDIESGNATADGTSRPENHNNQQESSDMNDKYFVIMAGEAKPTFLATPSSSRTASFGSSSWRSNSTILTEKSSSSEVEMSGRLDLLQGTNMENQEYTDHLA